MQKSLTHFSMLFTCLFTLCLAVPGLAAKAEDEDAKASGATATYGELLLIEQKQSPLKAWQIEAAGMQEFSNPYLDINGVSASVKKSIGHFVFVGPEYTRYFTQDSDVNKTVAQALKTDTIAQTVHRPQHSIYGVVSVIPIAGHLNLFNTNSLPFELEFSLGYGTVDYERKPSQGALLWRVGPRAFVSDLIGLQFQFGQEIEAIFGGDKVTKSHGRLGMVVRF